MFTKEQTDSIAEILSESFCRRPNGEYCDPKEASKDQWNEIVLELKELFSRDNSDFDRKKFEEVSTPVIYDIDCIASGYEWICPECDSTHRMGSFSEEQECSDCNIKIRLNPPEHAYD